ncbi:multidrug ABC transporter ATPase [Microbacterium sp.]|uniref:multidrug ABC transporter ATPase n=1 Tax=Microbacterium sp. TaxID=51671 RepID=UPI003A8F7A52
MSAPTPADVPVRRIDRILSFVALGLLVLAVVCFFTIIIGTALHVDQTAPVWGVLFWITAAAPVIAFGCILAVLLTSFVRKSRANKVHGGEADRRAR